MNEENIKKEPVGGVGSDTNKASPHAKERKKFEIEVRTKSKLLLFKVVDFYDGEERSLKRLYAVLYRVNEEDVLRFVSPDGGLAREIFTVLYEKAWGWF